MNNSLLLLLGAAEGSSAGGGSAMTSLIPFALIFLIMYLLIIRPQSRKQKALRNMIANLKKGDHVITIGGIHGTVHQVYDKTVIILVDSVKMEFNKESVATIVNASDKKATSSKNTTKSKKEALTTASDETKKTKKTKGKKQNPESDN